MLVSVLVVHRHIDGEGRRFTHDHNSGGGHQPEAHAALVLIHVWLLRLRMAQFAAMASLAGLSCIGTSMAKAGQPAVSQPGAEP